MASRAKLSPKRTQQKSKILVSDSCFFSPIHYQNDSLILMTLKKQTFENIMKQERQIVTKYARLTPSCNHPRNFIAIASIVLEICTGQNSSMKINKGQ